MVDHDQVEAAQAALDRLMVLNQAASVLASTLDAEAGLSRLCRVLVPALADWCVADLADEDGGVQRVCVQQRDSPTDATGLTGPIAVGSVEGSWPLGRVLRGAGPVRLSESEMTGALIPPRGHRLVADPVAHLGGHSMIIAPLRSRRQVLGALTLVRGYGREEWPELDVRLVEDLAGAIALAVDNARLYAQTSRVAERLQRALLPPIPVIDGLSIVARYSPAMATAQIGGDWYDCFSLPGGDAALVIGDVAGHDLAAAVAMSQIRNMLRGIACDRQEPPGAIVRRLDAAVSTLYRNQTGTCVYGLLKTDEQGGWEFAWSRAGHPPPLLVGPGGDTTFLDEANGPLLGLTPEAERDSSSVVLPPGHTLLLYTDGLIERRGEVLDHGLTRLRQHAATLVGQDLDVMCDDLMSGLARDSDLLDDVAVLAVRTPS